jgi:hypothetical protein
VENRSSIASNLFEPNRATLPSIAKSIAEGGVPLEKFANAPMRFGINRFHLLVSVAAEGREG